MRISKKKAIMKIDFWFMQESDLFYLRKVKNKIKNSGIMSLRFMEMKY